MRAARLLVRRGEGPRLLPVRVAYEGPVPDAIDNAQDAYQYFTWRDTQDNDALLRAMIEALAPASSFLRFNGLYHHEFAQSTRVLEWFRFYPDGRVFSITTTGATPEQAARQLSKEMGDGMARVGSYESDGVNLRMEFKSERDEADGWHYIGVLGKDTLSLNAFSGRRKSRVWHHDLQFAAVAGVAPPPSSLRFDGMYVSEPWLADDIHPEKDWGWEVSALRFSSDGTLFFASAWGYNMEQRKRPDEHDLRGTYSIDGTDITLTFNRASGEPEIRRAKIDGETVVLSGSNTSGYHFRQDED
jgi:hypothetical protein